MDESSNNWACTQTKREHKKVYFQQPSSKRPKVSNANEERLTETHFSSVDRREMERRTTTNKILVTRRLPAQAMRLLMQLTDVDNVNTK